MKLLTQNLLRSNIKGVKRGYPLAIEAAKIEFEDVEFNAEFAKKMLDRIDWECLKQACAQVDKGEFAFLRLQYLKL